MVPDSYLFFLVFVPFSSSPDVSSKISPQPFKIETSNLVYRFTTTSYYMGLKMDVLLFVLLCIFLSLYIFLLRYQPYALEALKQGYSHNFLTVLVSLVISSSGGPSMLNG